jgi:hypothetical protein
MLLQPSLRAKQQDSPTTVAMVNCQRMSDVRTLQANIHIIPDWFRKPITFFVLQWQNIKYIPNVVASLSSLPSPFSTKVAKVVMNLVCIEKKGGGMIGFLILDIISLT